MPLLSVCFGFWQLSCLSDYALVRKIIQQPVFLSARIMAAAFGGRFISSLEAQRILLSTHYGANCIYPGENHTVPRLSFHHSTPEQLPPVNNRGGWMSLLVWSHSVRYRCIIFPLMSVTNVLFSSCVFFFWLSSSDLFPKGRRGRGPVWKPCHRSKSSLGVIFPVTQRPSF